MTAHDEPCTQGHNCAASFSPDGSKASAHYGSTGYDTSTFATAPGLESSLARLDPVCDACLAQAMLCGRIVDISEDGFYAHSKVNIGNHPRALASRRKTLALALAQEAHDLNLGS